MRAGIWEQFEVRVYSGKQSGDKIRIILVCEPKKQQQAAPKIFCPPEDDSKTKSSSVLTNSIDITDLSALVRSLVLF